VIAAALAIEFDRRAELVAQFADHAGERGARAFQFALQGRARHRHPAADE